MGLVVAVLATKGGCGKSTLAAALAAHWHGAGHRALLVDADPQGTCVRWGAAAAAAGLDGPPVVAMAAAALRRDVPRLAAELVVIDAPPKVGAEIRAAALCADLVVVPVAPSPADLWALEAVRELLTDARELRPELRAGLVLNRCDRRTTMAAVVGEALAASGLPLLGTVGARVAFAEALATGEAVAGPGAVEVAELAAAVVDLVRRNGAGRM